MLFRSVVLQRPPSGDGEGWLVCVARDVTDRIDAQDRARSAEREVAVLEDRQRIARDLHDKVIQRLFAAGMGLEAARGRIDDRATADRIAEIVTDLDDTIRELRSSIFELSRPPDTQSLRSQVLRVCESERAALGFDPTVRFDGAIDAIADGIGAELLTTLREALSNVARHAAATRATVTVVAATALTLRVEDDGRGIHGDEGVGGHGVRNMTARAEQLGGSCRIDPLQPHGTVVEWSVPLP